MIRLLTLLLLFSFVSLSAQQIVIADSATKETLPYAYIAFLQSDKALYSDKDGKLTLDDRFQAADSICIRMLGYHNRYASLAALHDTVFLTPKAYNLPEVTIQPLSEAIRLGDIKKYGKSKFIISMGTLFWPQKIATIIRDEKYAGCYIEKLLWRYHHHSAIHYVVRMQLYAVGNDGKPGEPLLQRSDHVTVEGEGLLSIDVSEEHLEFPAEGVFVGLEILEEINPYNKPMVNIRKLPYASLTTRTPQTYFSHIERTYWFAGTFSEHESSKVPFGLSVRCPK